MIREKIGDVTVHLNIKKEPLKNGTHALYIRVQQKNKNRYYSTRSEMPLKEWESFCNMPDSQHPAMQTYRNYVKCVTELVREEDFSFENLSARTERGRTGTLQEMILQRKNEFTKAGEGFQSENRYDNLHYSINKYLNGKPCPINKFSSEDCKKFMKWLYTELENSNTTVNMKMKELRAVFNIAVKSHIIRNNPLKGIKLPPSERKDLSVSRNSLSKLLNTGADTIGEKEMAWLHMWRLMYYGNGMNPKDLLLLKWDNVDMDKRQIKFIRNKTQKHTRRPVVIPITNTLLDSLNAVPHGKEHVLPFLDGCQKNSRKEFNRIRQSTKNISSHMKKICKTLNIKENITCSYARHCFATVMQQNNVPIGYISSAMGHSNIKTTQNYLDGFTQEQMMENGDKLLVE